ncbi:Crp/Fnr family transcriptional regulator [Treponema primitia]|uniref:Crp/Fnr family transcriptional regulator n=1 Tax=Treponema primitia TaxID=88058 RepID=UPI0002554D2E|nr:Crp/Fnr family transcriptional regulator [Treponema primitia]
MNTPLLLTFVNFKKNSYIVVEGKRNADRFFIIREGKVQISKAVEVVEEEGGNLLGPGDFFSVVSTMSNHSHIETAQALTDVTLISVQKEQYGELIQKNTAVAMKIILQFSRRMRYLDEALTKLTLKNNSEDNVSQLFIVGEYYAKISQFNLAYYAYSQYLKHSPRGVNFNATRERMMKIAPYVKSPPQVFPPNESARKYTKGTMIFSEGEPGDELYIIQKGSVKIIKIADNNEVLLAVLKTGDIFGEMALLESKPRTACAVAYEDCMLLMVSRANFARMVATQPQIIAKLTTLLSERIWFIYKQIANTLLEDPIGRIYDALLIQLEKSRVDSNVEQSYIFDFGPNELINMVGISPADGTQLIRKFMNNRNIQLVNGKICVLDVFEIAKQTQYYRNMQRIEKSRHSTAKKARH